MRELYVAIGVDCDPDRDSYPRELTWRGIEAIPRLFDLKDVKWTFNIRADSQVRDFHGSAAYCYERYRKTWDEAAGRGCALAWHLHYFDRDGRQDVSEENILANIRLGSEALGRPDLVHMGWTFQNDFSIRHLYEAGVRVDYSPLPRYRFAGRKGTDASDWSRFAYRPSLWHGVRMIPTYTLRNRLLSIRFRTERVMLTTTTAPFLYRLLLRDFFRTGSDFFVTYFHIDEIVSALGDWRRYLYSYENLKLNIRTLVRLAGQHDFTVRFVNIRELAGVLFDERDSGNA
ncbi:MAG TPA: hypothetical protein VMY05_07865 [Acidobacteriota bacterium]|nr:hypothetical protein [Acidobacteriota bacterium]